VFYLRYLVAELGRRRGRTLLTALGLGVGVALVVVVNALSSGLDRAQAQVLEPLTGLGTDLSVSRPIEVNADGGAFPRLSEAERKQLEEENGGARIGLDNLGKPGEKFSRDRFLSNQISFPKSEVAAVRELEDVAGAAGSLTLNSIHIEGVVPDLQGQGGGFNAPAPAPGGPREIDAEALTVTGVDRTQLELAPVSPDEIETGRFFRNGKEAVLNVGYARRQGLDVGDTVTIGGAKLKVVGLARPPLGGQSSDVYMSLARLQKLADREGRVNAMQVRATDSDSVAGVAAAIAKQLDGATVTTAEDIAERVSGSLVDAKNLSGKLGTALAIVGLGGAFLIASLLSLASVAKRTRELGTLKALGWPQRLVVRQVTGEALLQGALGAAFGIALGLLGAALLDAYGPTLTATVADASQSTGPRVVGIFGQGSIASGSETVTLDAPVGLGILALAVALALAGGLVAGAAGALRASRLRPADALRHLD
jgi:ABC-type antimicrobial peptide transport system permease subunit